MKKFFMKLLFFFCFLGVGFYFILFCYYKFVNNVSGGWIYLFFFGALTLLFFWAFVSEEKEPEETPTVTNIDKPKEDEIISVTEIKGERKIIKNGKVIYCEQLKADELQVYEKLKDKN